MFDDAIATAASPAQSLPNNVEAEIHLLSSLLLDASSFDAVLNLKINKDDFYDLRHRHIFETISQLNDKGITADLVSITEQLNTSGVLEKAGGAGYISTLIDKIPTSANLEHYGTIVKQKSMLRSLIFISGDIISKSMDNPQEVKSLIDEAEQRILTINEEMYMSSLSGVKEVLNAVVEEIVNTSKNTGDLSGVPSGFPDMDEMTDGFQKQELIILAARPSAGKTSFALNVASNAALRYGKKIGFFSCEMGKVLLGQRLICAEARVDQMKVRKGLLQPSDKEKIVTAAERLYNTSMVFDDTPNIPILELRSKARKMKKDYNIDCLVIDYLQLITAGDEAGRGVPRHEQIGYISRSLKALARELDIPILSLAQLNRNIETRGDESRPKMSDLKDSGSIEQDADLIVFIHRVFDHESNNDESDYREIVIGKNRNGPTGIIKMRFFKSYTRFVQQTKTDEF